ncbi:pyroglutamyl-peptidase 1-like protein [Paroedura picta]|uniref:pyroglutamyl-peptidase 1-like protein n=1 Tax=Paroedura picta TaxID=143630 RepID=UPI0040562337
MAAAAALPAYPRLRRRVPQASRPPPSALPRPASAAPGPPPPRPGFGPYRKYFVNSSWAAVKEMSKLGLGSEIDLHITELPVVYQKARELVCEMWTTGQPHLVIHVGLDSASKATIILEQYGKNKGYKERDVCGFLPEDGCCVSEGPERIESVINMKRVWKTILTEGIDAIFSRDAGRRAAFIHVPPLSKWVTAEFLGRELQRVILEILKQCKWQSRE